MYSSKKDFVFSDRSRKIEKPEKRERILDTLARLLQGPSECVAVTFIRGKFLIAANELFSGSKENKINKFIHDMMGYLREIARGEKTSNRRIEILSQICLAASQNTAKGKVTITPDIANQVVKNSLTEGYISHFAFNRKYGSNVRAAAIVYGEFVRINRDLSKMEMFLQKNKELYQDLLETFRNSQYDILTTSLEPGVHAEAQILAEILLDPYASSPEKQELYIGISKLCCLHCRVLLDTTNLVLLGEGINLTLKFRGRHDLDFTWIPPEAFSRGFDCPHEEINEKNEKEDIYFRIGFATARTISELLLEKKPTGISQLPSPSSSETEVTEEEKMNQYQANLLQVENILNSLPFESIKANKEAVSLGLDLLSVNSFRGLFNESYKEESAEYLFVVLKGGLERKGKQVNDFTLLNFLQNPLFCGKEIAHYFQSYQLPASSSKETINFSKANTSSPVINFPPEPSPSTPPWKKQKSNTSVFGATLSESVMPIQTQPTTLEEDEEISKKTSGTQTKLTSDFFKSGMPEQEGNTTDETHKSYKGNSFKK